MAELGVPMIQGMQAQGIASTVKHFTLYSMPRGGREGAAHRTRKFRRARPMTKSSTPSKKPSASATPWAP